MFIIFGEKPLREFFDDKKDFIVATIKSIPATEIESISDINGYALDLLPRLSITPLSVDFSDSKFDWADGLGYVFSFKTSDIDLISLKPTMSILWREKAMFQPLEDGYEILISYDYRLDIEDIKERSIKAKANIEQLAKNLNIEVSNFNSTMLEFIIVELNDMKAYYSTIKSNLAYLTEVVI